MKKRITKFEKKELQKQKLEKNLNGTGIFVFENVTNGDLSLPKATLSGKKIIKAKEQFEGDSYFMNFVKTPNNLLKLVRKIETIKENNMTEKLILDQPERVTSQGTVENVLISNPKKQLNDANQNDNKDVLLTEDPMEGVEIICN